MDLQPEVVPGHIHVELVNYSGMDPTLATNAWNRAQSPGIQSGPDRRTAARTLNADNQTFNELSLDSMVR
jgi:hypothetical protein